MKNVKLKVCGMCASDNIREIALLHPDYMGFIFFKDSPRFVGEHFTIPKGHPPEIKKVGVFVNESSENILELARRHRLDFVQLHGTESVETCHKIRNEGIGVIKVFSLHNGFDFNQVNPYKTVVDYFLFDAKGQFFGGNGVVFDWDILKQYNQEVPFFLSGGIAPDHIPAIKALEGVNLYALDVNSGVELSVGLKDALLVEKMLKF